MASQRQKEEVLEHWNSKKIIVHKRLNHDMSTEIARTLKYYTMEEVKEFIDLYATILEPGVPEAKQKYWWTYKWNLYEFLKRGIKKFDGHEASDYQKTHTVEAEALVFKREK